MIIAISGYQGAGKTTFIEGLLSLLEDKYDVLTIKDTHMDGIDVREKDTSRHSEAGAYASAITAEKETAVFFNKRMDAEEIAALIDVDVVLLEGFKKSGYPKIWLGGGEGENVIMKNPTVEEAYKYIFSEIEKERILEKLPRIDCGECGHATCGEMAEAIMEGDATIDDCRVLRAGGVRISVDGENLPLNKFVGEVVENTIRGMLSPMKNSGDVKGGKVTIELPAKGDNF